MPVKLKQEYPDALCINTDPPLYLLEDFISDAECEHLVELSRPHLQPAVVSGGTDGVPSEGRSGAVHWIPHAHTEITLALSQRVAELVGLPLVNAESIQVVNYAEGQEYKPHFDAWEHNTEVGERCLARGGQRLVTCLGYLNDVSAGGGTYFPKLDIETMPRKGRLVLFHNCYPDSAERHASSLHGGMPLESGEKWACNFWFRENEFQVARRDPNRPSASTRRF